MLNRSLWLLVWYLHVDGMIYTDPILAYATNASSYHWMQTPASLISPLGGAANAAGNDTGGHANRFEQLMMAPGFPSTNLNSTGLLSQSPPPSPRPPPPPPITSPPAQAPSVPTSVATATTG